MTMYSSDYSSSGASGSSVLKIQNITSDGIIEDWNYLVLADASTSTTTKILTITLPMNTINSIGKSITIKKTDSSSYIVCIKANGTDTINNSTNNIYLYGTDDVISITSTGVGQCVTTPDNRNSTGNTSSFLRVTKPTGQSTPLASGSTILFDTTEIIQGGGISYNPTTGTFTLQPNRTYKLKCGFSKINLSSGGYFYMKWYNDTTSTQVGTVGGGDAVTSPSSTMASDMCTYSITPTVTTTLRCLITGISSVTGIESPWAEVEEISRQATVINTVDSMFCYKTSNQSSVVAGTVLTWDKMVGNMVTSSPYITLKAGTTYEIMFAVSATVNTAGGEVYLSLYDSTGTLLPDQVQAHIFTATSISNDGTSGTGYCKITPSSDIQIQTKVYNLFGCTSANIRIDGTWLKITQIGSSAVSTISPNLVDLQYKAYTPVITGSTTSPTMGTGYSLKGLFSVIGKSLEVDFNLYQATSGTAGSGYYKISIPDGYFIDTTKISAIASPTSVQGDMSGVDSLPVGIGYVTTYNAVYSNPSKVVVLDSTHIGIFMTRDDSTYAMTLWGSGYAGLSVSKLNVSFTCKLPII